MKILNLYSGIGGNRKLWDNCEITAVEKNPIISACYEYNFPEDTVICGDVFEFIRLKKNNINQYDFIWSSPPCQTHSQMQAFHLDKDYLPDIPNTSEICGLYNWLSKHYRGLFCIENVKLNYPACIKPSFKVGRHWFWGNFSIPSLKIKVEKNTVNVGYIGNTTFRQFEKKYGIKAKYIEDIKDRLLKRRIMRNCVNPNVGKYVLDNLRNNLEPLNFFLEFPGTDEKKIGSE